MILSDRERKFARPFQRLMLMMSIFDVLQSIAFAISVTAFPQESDIFGAKGNELTCTAQGFFVTLGLAVPLYNMNLNIFYVLTIRCRFTSQQYAKFEPVAHIVSICLPLFIAIISAAHNEMMPRGNICYPRGKLPLLLCSITIFVCFLICIISMVCICRTVTSQATRMERYTVSCQRSRIDEDKRKAVKQACTYALAFILTYMFPIIGTGYIRGRTGVEVPIAVTILTSIFYPLQGFWNFLLYVRPGVQHVMESHPEKSFVRATCDVVFNPESVVLRHRRSLARTSVTSIKRTSTVSHRLCPLCQTNEPNSGEILNSRELRKIPDDFDEFEAEEIPDEYDEFEAEAKGQSIITCLSDPTTPCGPVEDLEHQSKAYSRPKILRRLLRVENTSILNDTNSVDSKEAKGITTCLSDPTPCETVKDFEHQSKAYSRPKTPRRQSLVEIASILNDMNSIDSNDVSIDS